MINFESITSLNSYVRTSEMTKKWTDKKKAGDLTRHDDLTVSESWRQKKMPRTNSSCRVWSMNRTGSVELYSF